MKKILILGAEFQQVKLMEAANELGYKTVVCSIPGEYPGLSVADEVAYEDITDCEAVFRAAKDHDVQGIATCCSDTGIFALGYACEKMGFSGLSAFAGKCCSDKSVMKNAFMEHGVHTAKYYEIKNADDISGIPKRLNFPVILKALNMAGSRGIYICQNEQELYTYYRRLQQLIPDEPCLVEEYIEGRELGAQAFVYHGEILFILPHGDITYMARTAIPVGHFAPILLSDDLNQKIVKEAEKAIHAIGLDDCAINIDLIERDGEIYVIELSGRAGATALPELVSIYYGIDYYKMIVLVAMGENPKVEFGKRHKPYVANLSQMLLSEKAGVVKKITNQTTDISEVYEVYFSVKEGDKVRKFSNAGDRLGQVIVEAASLEECRMTMDHVLKNIKIEVG